MDFLFVFISSCVPVFCSLFDVMVANMIYNSFQLCSLYYHQCLYHCFSSHAVVRSMLH